MHTHIHIIFVWPSDSEQAVLNVSHSPGISRNSIDFFLYLPPIHDSFLPSFHPYHISFAQVWLPPPSTRRGLPPWTLGFDFRGFLCCSYFASRLRVDLAPSFLTVWLGLLPCHLGLQQWPVPLNLAISHGQECQDHNEPVEVVRDDGAVCCRVGPSEDGIEEAPASAAIEFGAAALRWVSSVSRSCEGVG